MRKTKFKTINICDECQKSGDESFSLKGIYVTNPAATLGGCDYKLVADLCDNCFDNMISHFYRSES